MLSFQDVIKIVLTIGLFVGFIIIPIIDFILYLVGY